MHQVAAMLLDDSLFALASSGTGKRDKVATEVIVLKQSLHSWPEGGRGKKID